MKRAPESVAEVVANGLCIGCGLCESVTNGRVRMVWNGRGSLRPVGVFAAEEEAQILAACPGAKISPRVAGRGEVDDIWGEYFDMRYAWAGDADIRHRGATGGVLTALAVHLLKRRQVDFVLQVRADPDAPTRNVWTLSETPDAVVACVGSRYAPVAPLAGLHKALARRRPFAIVAKPCDLTAVHQWAAVDGRVDRWCRYRLAMVCGGQSRYGKTAGWLAETKVAEAEVRLLRYRGYGNPGPTRLETTDGRAFEKSYLEMWADESGWQIETRCKLCADPLGEAADVAAADLWPDAVPEGEDEGFNGIVVRTEAGRALVETAVAAGDLALGEPLTPAALSATQPHQVAKKMALSARYQGMTDAGAPIPTVDGRLRLGELGRRLSPQRAEAERQGTRRRVESGKFAETPVS